MGDFFKSKFDNLSLLLLLFVMMGVLLHMSHDKADTDLVAWLEQALTTALGAYIGLTQAHRVPWLNKNGGINGTSKSLDNPVVPGAVLPTYPKQ